ncbi:hypothetical protein O181_047080 [Austropuccinia psidii MF-1]|uniref:Uncharacterized protein n=1 Tax=Austropuccinia psidii MF-1 TaxID=1389203 RepID=A0A9Q3DUM9_9BASI|nr:hypothetical protein [Austropuccinia psidii MF-1]
MQRHADVYRSVANSDTSSDATSRSSGHSPGVMQPCKSSLSVNYSTRLDLFKSVFVLFIRFFEAIHLI